ncbi:phytanoyl-CoA dioxygenase family protein [uncultured Roseibium sp.]|uniref:phytanoyl-CoA dioxygenase family protein n=1 Tax=uncultured Roseibium sp. TaxID=1936171 RepID=UPI002631FAB7|nr:phytanoyl-CoA dioxygenase family protein [uncultured Roseibium sp.]
MDQHVNSDGYFEAQSCSLRDFKEIVSRRLSPSDVPHADRVDADIPIYEIAAIEHLLSADEGRRRLMTEWARVLKDGSGALVLSGAYSDTSPLDKAAAVFQQIILEEKASTGGGADHFAAAGANDRVWNSLQKLCLREPDVFASCFSNVAIDAVCEAWLGPNYQMTSQVNLVRPGGAAQQAHRDYHLGFQTAETCAGYPAHVHDLSPVMTLQGAIAHTDMPVESGPTKLLPFSQLYRPGYMAYRQEEFSDFFETACVQLPLRKGDALFFNPALFHAAGENKSNNIQRLANLLQVSSAFCRAMETLDRQAMCNALYPVLLEKSRAGTWPWARFEAAVSACAEGYSFPTNLDTDPPIGGLAPETQKQLFLKSLEEGRSREAFAEALEAQARRRSA